MSRSVLRSIVFLMTLIAGLVLFTNSAQAQTSRLYFATYLGLSTFNSLEFSDSSAGVGGEMEVDDAYSYAGALGLRLSKTLRAEAEFSYRNSDISQIGIDGSGSFDASGELTSWTGLLNVYYDFDVPWKIKPFVGAGVGFGWHDADIVDGSGLASNTVDDTLNVMWQVGGGLKYPISPALAFTSSYRYLDGTDLELGPYEIDYGNHEFRLGIQYDLPAK